MNPARFRGIVRGEIATLRRLGQLDEATAERLLARYPDRSWDWSRLGRWFGAFGAVSAAAGASILGHEIFVFTLEKLAFALGILTLGLIAGGARLTGRGYRWTGRSLELAGGLSLIGLSFTIGAIVSTGSGNWPALLLIDLLILLPLAYLRHNPLLLILTAIVFFSWWGGVTGYVSGWGAYWFGMNYPVRFLLAGLAFVGIGALHRTAESGLLLSYRGFFRIWLSAGLFFAEMSLWLMSLFGNFGSISEYHNESGGELFFFNVLWAGFNAALLWAGSRYGLSMLRGYAVTFGIIQAYTLYFWKIASHLGPIFSTFLAGAVTLWAVFQFEQHRRARSANPTVEETLD